MSNTVQKKRSKRRSKTYRQIGMIINLSFFVIIIVVAIVGVFHTFTNKRDYRDKGVSYYEQGDYENAIQSFDKALRCKQWFSGKLNVDIELYKADSYIKLTDYDEAGKVYQEITDKYPKRYYDSNEVKFMIKLCEALQMYKNGDYYSPVPYLTEAVEHGYNDMCLNVAYCYEQQNNYDKMIAYYDKHIAAVGITGYVAYKYADYYIYTGDYSDALSYVNQGIMLNSEEYMQKLKYLEIICYKGMADFETAYNYALTYNTEYPDDEAGADILAYLDTRVNINTNLVNDVYNVGNGQ